jgi:hypothetical protein
VQARKRGSSGRRCGRTASLLDCPHDGASLGRDAEFLRLEGRWTRPARSPLGGAGLFTNLGHVRQAAASAGSAAGGGTTVTAASRPLATLDGQGSPLARPRPAVGGVRAGGHHGRSAHPRKPPRSRLNRSGFGSVEALVCPGLLQSRNWISSCDAGGLEVLELGRAEHAQRAVTALALVKDLQVLKDRVGSRRVRQRCRSSSSTCMRDQNNPSWRCRSRRRRRPSGAPARTPSLVG